MSMIKKPGFVVAIALIAVLAVAVGAVVAQKPVRLGASANGPFAKPIPQQLPSVERGPMSIRPIEENNLSILSFDDGTCESGLGAGVTVTDFHEFDVPTQCTQSGLAVVALTTRMNTGVATAAALGQAGATPPVVGAGTFNVLATAIPAFGPCNTGGVTTLTQRTFTDNKLQTTAAGSNFFAGHRNTGFGGRDSNGPPAGRMWLNCGACGMTQYSPTTLSGLGLGGNWMIRVTVRDKKCVPVELMEFSID